MSESILEKDVDTNEKDMKVIEELGLYNLRIIEIEDMELKIEELKIGDAIGVMNYEERVQTSMKCKNNDYILNEISMLEKKISLYKIRNKRIDNAFKVLTDEERVVIQKLYIDKLSKSQTAREMYKTRKSIRNIATSALQKIKLA